MKNKILFMSLVVGMALCACENRELPTLSDNVTAPVLNAPSSSSVVLTEATAADTVVRFSWEAPDYGYDAPVSYVLKVDKAGNNFKDAIDIATSLKNSVGLTAEALNSKLLLLGGVDGTAMNLEFKVVASIANTKIADQISNVVSMAATPYEVVIIYPHLNLPGSYDPYGGDNGTWDGDGNDYTRIFSLKSDNRYEGYVNMIADGDPSKAVEFKFTKVNWGDGEYSYSGTAGKLISGGGGNIPLTSGGYYKVSADLNSLTYSVTKITTWGIIGSATSKGWDSSTPMTYDPATNKWTVTVTLTAQEFKFRANDAWDIAYGDVNGDFKLDTENNNNIKVPSAGNYTITLDLVGPVYKYKMVKN